MAGFLARATGWLRKSANPDWGTLERYLAWAFGGGAASSGVIVNPQTALQAGAVFACVRVLTQTLGMVPLNLYSVGSDGAKTTARGHSLWPILHDQPNDYQTSTEFWEMMMVSLALRGNGYAYVNRTQSGRVVELLPLHPDMVRPEMRADFTIIYNCTLNDGSFKQYSLGEIMHLRGMTVNGWLGISPIAYARESIGLALAAEKFGGQLFRNGAKMGGVLEHPGKVGAEAYKRLKDSFDEATSGENAHKTALLEEGMKFTPMSITPEDSQFLDTRKFQRSDIAGFYGVPLHMIGDLERATFSNIEQQSLDFVQFTMMPWFVRLEKAIKRDLFSNDDKKSLEVRFNPAGMLRGDGAARTAYYQGGIQSGWLTRNEARRMESDIGIVLNPLAGLDLPLAPLNMGDGTKPPAPQPKPTPANPAPGAAK